MLRSLAAFACSILTVSAFASEVGDLHRSLIKADGATAVGICRRLGELANPNSVRYLEWAATQMVGNVRTEATIALTRYFRSGPDAYGRQWAVFAVQRLVPDPKLLLPLLDSADPVSVECGIDALEGVRDQRVINSLVRLLKTPPNEELQYRSARRLTEIGAAEAAPTFLEWLKDKRAKRNRALSYFETVRVPESIDHLSGPDALPARCRQGDGKAVLEAIELLRSPDPKVVSSALYALERDFGETAREGINTYRLSGGAESKRAAAYQVARGDLRGWETLLDARPQEALYFIRAFNITPVDGQGGEILRCVATKPARRDTAIAVLAKLPLPQSVSALRELKADPRTVADVEFELGTTSGLRAQRSALDQTREFLSVPYDGSSIAAAKAWRPMLEWIRHRLEAQFTSTSVVREEVERRWLKLAGIYQPIYVTIADVPGSRRAVYVRIWCSQLIGMDPERGEIRRDPQVAALYWRDGGRVRLQNITTLLATDYKSPLIPTATAGHAAALGDEVVLAGSQRQDGPASEIGFVWRLKLVDGVWRRADFTSIKFRHANGDVLIQTRGGQYMAEIHLPGEPGAMFAPVYLKDLHSGLQPPHWSESPELAASHILGLCESKGRGDLRRYLVDPSLYDKVRSSPLMKEYGFRKSGASQGRDRYELVLSTSPSRADITIAMERFGGVWKLSSIAY